MLSVRDFRIYKKEKDGEQLIGCCKIVWAILDREKREIVNLFDMDIFKNSVDGEVMKMARASKMLPLVLDELEQDPDVIRVQEKTHTIQYADMDYNCHCNSTKYLEWMLNARRMQDNTKPFRLDINYVKDLYLGEQMLTRYAERANSVRYQQVDKSGSTCVFHKDSVFCAPCYSSSIPLGELCRLSGYRTPHDYFWLSGTRRISAP
jgi:acyl-ACP thioesterase